MAPKKGKSSKSASQVPDSEHIVFSNKSDGGKKSKDKQGEKGTANIDTTTAATPPRQDTRKIIGGASWTGKLPVNLLSEHCQREKWNKPDYSMYQGPPKDQPEPTYRSAVTLSKTDPQTRQTTTIPPFRLPKEHESLAERPSALEARHFAATYALFRVSSMKNIHMALPPQYRDLWKGEFAQLKKADEAAGQGWRYDADPFAAEAKRQDIHVAMEKRKKEQAEKEANQAKPSFQLPTRNPEVAKYWRRAPKLELGPKTRTQIEEVIKSNTQWNVLDVKLSKGEKVKIVQDLTKHGFRASHVREAIEYCKDEEEALEWLLVHVPEDDLPQWTFPPGYSAGISLASGDIVREAKLKQLALGGYSSEQCVQALRAADNDNVKAAELLQSNLASLAHDSTCPSDPEDWKTETEMLREIFSDRFEASDPSKCTISINPTSTSTINVHFQCPRYGYNQLSPPIIVLEADSVPAYIKLSITRQAAIHARQNLLGEQMIYSLVEWLEEHIPAIVENPGPLMTIDSGLGHIRNDKKHVTADRTPNNVHKPHGRLLDRRSDHEILEEWKTRQNTSAQERMLSARQRLPAWSQRSAVISAVRDRQVTIITGDTGSGKSTQSVQFILDQAIQDSKGRNVNILCTQPRRIAAIALCDRVSAERCSIEGEEVGYIIRGESKQSSKTKITFMTTGVLLRRLQTSSSFEKALTDVTHVFIDEVHERSLDTDFLLALFRQHLQQLPHLKLVLMSATLNADLFTSYFGGPSKVSRAHIEGRTFPVQDFYLDHVIKLTNFGDAYQGDDVDEEQSITTKAIRSLGPGINYSLITALVAYIDVELGSISGGILVFLPGVAEIERCVQSLADRNNIYAVPLHASLLASEQRRAFPPAPRGKRKVVVATNVAETSITIDDIVAVIDTGRVKETRYDTASNIVRLEEVWASQAACKQRRGRAGRVRKGSCYKLFTKNIEVSMPEATVPEIQRVPLEQLCLSVKSMGSIADASAFLSQTLSPPDQAAILNAIRALHRTGALDHDQLTGLGQFLAMIPADLKCAKLLVYACMFGCLEVALTAAAILTTRSPFVSPRDKRDEAKAARSRFSTSDGDLINDVTAFEAWQQKSADLRGRDLWDWCSSNFLSQHNLRDIVSARTQLLSALKEAALVPLEYKHDSTAYHVLNAHKDNSTLFRALLAGALHPQIAEISLPDKKYLQSMTGAKELDPDAKTIKYFNEENGRVFVHPSSVLFDAQAFSGAACYVSYFSKMATSKTFIRDLTPLNPYSLLLFGGNIEVDKTGAGLVVDGWLRLQGWARIGVLASRLRSLLDEELRRRIDTPGLPSQEHGIFDIASTLEYEGTTTITAATSTSTSTVTTTTSTTGTTTVTSTTSTVNAPPTTVAESTTTTITAGATTTITTSTTTTLTSTSTISATTSTTSTTTTTVTQTVTAAGGAKKRDFGQPKRWNFRLKASPDAGASVKDVHVLVKKASKEEEFNSILNAQGASSSSAFRTFYSCYETKTTTATATVKSTTTVTTTTVVNPTITVTSTDRVTATSTTTPTARTTATVTTTVGTTSTVSATATVTSTSIVTSTPSVTVPPSTTTTQTSTFTPSTTQTTTITSYSTVTETATSTTTIGPSTPTSSLVDCDSVGWSIRSYSVADQQGRYLGYFTRNTPAECRSLCQSDGAIDDYVNDGSCFQWTFSVGSGACVPYDSAPDNTFSYAHATTNIYAGASDCDNNAAYYSGYTN